MSDKSFREAADPMIIIFKGDYYLFASKSGGYWWSPDFQHWKFISTVGLDIEKYAPSVFVIADTMYYTSSSKGAIYRTTEPKSGKWTYVSHPYDWNDPWIFVNDDGKVYAYFGSSEGGTIDCVQLDPNNKFTAIGNSVHCIYTNTEKNGFEVNGDNNESGKPWTEGSSMFKYNDRYYLTYATPGTEKRSYADAYYTSASPMGPFTLGINSPQTRRSLGYVTGTGHGGLFYDKNKQLWSIVTTVISKKSFFERRLAVFPAEISPEGYLHVNTIFGDYPQFLPGSGKRIHGTDNLAGWNLLSKGKSATASSTFANNYPSNAVDENIKTSWSATSGNRGEWMQIDLGTKCKIDAIQVNFSEVETTYHEGRKIDFATRYKLESSDDGVLWRIITDKSGSNQDQPHDYLELDAPFKARYIKITNTGDVPGYGYFALSDLRIFGNTNLPKAAAIGKFEVLRKSDSRWADLTWPEVKGAEGYVIRYGIAADKLWNHYQVTGSTSYSIRSLVAGQPYYFRIDTYNSNGVTMGTQTLRID